MGKHLAAHTERVFASILFSQDHTFCEYLIWTTVCEREGRRRERECFRVLTKLLLHSLFSVLSPQNILCYMSGWWASLLLPCWDWWETDAMCIISTREHVHLCHLLPSSCDPGFDFWDLRHRKGKAVGQLTRSRCMQGPAQGRHQEWCAHLSPNCKHLSCGDHFCKSCCLVTRALDY